MIRKFAFLFIIFLLSNDINAQVMPGRPQWVTIKSTNLKCWECREKLEKYLTMENNANMDNGLIKWNINLLSAEIRIQYHADRVTVAMIKTAMNNAGFDADDSKALEEEYKKLPQACKRPADGGGPQKGKPCHIQPY